MSAQTEALKRNFIKPALCAGVGAAMTMAEGFPSFDLKKSIPLVGGMNLSPLQYGAVIGLASCFITESLSNILTGVTKDSKLQNAESFVVHSASSMAAWVYLPMLLGGQMPQGVQAAKLARVGFVSEIFSQWVHENFVEDGSFGQDILDLI